MTKRERDLYELLRKYPDRKPRVIGKENGYQPEELKQLLERLWEKGLYEYEIEIDMGRANALQH